MVGNIEKVSEWHFRESPGVLIGPVAWKFVVYNPLDRPVSVISLDVFYIPKEGLAKYSDLLNGVTESSTNSIMNFPVTLAGREAIAFNLNLNIPAEADEESEENCINSGTHISEIEKCLYVKGRDLFGNGVTVQSRTTDHLNVSWSGSFDSPTFLLILKTADDSEISKIFRYYPELGG